MLWDSLVQPVVDYMGVYAPVRVTNRIIERVIALVTPLTDGLEGVDLEVLRGSLVEVPERDLVEDFMLISGLADKGLFADKQEEVDAVIEQLRSFQPKAKTASKGSKKMLKSKTDAEVFFDGELVGGASNGDGVAMQSLTYKVMNLCLAAYGFDSGTGVAALEAVMPDWKQFQRDIKSSLDACTPESTTDSVDAGRITCEITHHAA